MRSHRWILLFVALLSTAMSPIRRDIDPSAPPTISGDHSSTWAHRILWNRDGFLATLPGKKFPEPTMTTDVAVVGGGLSGLLVAYQLRDQNPMIFELAERLGGNAQGEAWLGMEHSIGSAYVGVPDKDSEIEKLLKDLGVLDKMKVHFPDADPIYVNGKAYRDIWTNGISADSKSQFNLLQTYFDEMAEGLNGRRVPEVPPTSEEQRKYTETFDQVNFQKHLETVVNGPLHPEVYAVLDRYCWSALGAGIEEVSSSAALNFFVGDSKGVLFAPGGNAAIAEALMKEILKSTPLNNIKTGALVANVKVLDGGGADVTYVKSDMSVVTVRAKKVFMSTPKFVAAKVIENLEPTRLEAIRKLKYRSYLVANVLINKNTLLDQNGQPKFFDAFFVDPSEKRGDVLVPRSTDVLYGNYASPTPDKVVLTMYRPVPNDGARGHLMTATAKSLAAEFQEYVMKEVLPALEVPAEHFGGIRVALWGHAIPVAQPGHFSAKDGSGLATVDHIRASFKDTVYFANQDGVSLPGFESLAFEAYEAVVESKFTKKQNQCRKVFP